MNDVDPVELPETMRAVQLTDERVVEVVNLPIPHVRADEVLVRVLAGGVCGSDLSAWKGTHPFRKPPVVLGHEIVGVVAAAGTDVDPAVIGRRVAVEPQRICGACSHCLRGDNELCPSRTMPGMGEWAGGLATYFASPAARCFVLPENLDTEVAALAEPLAVALHATARAGVSAHHTVSIIGAGTIGALVAVSAVAEGATVLNIVDLDPQKLAFAESLGARRPVLASRDAPLSSDLEKADVTVVAVTGPNSIIDAERMTKPGGTILLLGLYAGNAIIDAASLVTSEQRITASVTYNSADFVRSIDLLSRRPELFRSFITRRINFDEVQGEFESQSSGADFNLKTLVIP